MTKTKERKKFNEENVEKASRALRAAVEAIREYDRVWNLLTPAEKLVTGGIVVAVQGRWEGLRLIGVTADPNLGRALIEQLTLYFRNSLVRQQRQTASSLHSRSLDNSESESGGAIVTPPNPEADRIAKEKAKKNKNLNEVLGKYKKKEE